MATSTANSGAESDQRLLSHFANRLLETHGGSISVAQVAERATTQLAIDGVEQLIIDGESQGAYTVLTDETQEIVAVDPIGSEPQTIATMFGEGVEIEDIPTIDERTTELLREADYHTCRDVSTASPEALREDVNEALEEQDGFRTPRAAIPEAVVTDSELDTLASEGYSSIPTLARASQSVLESAAPTITGTKAAEIQEAAREEAGLLDESRATALIEAAESQLPNTPRLYGDSLARYASRIQNGTGSARVSSVEDETDQVGDPLVLTHSDVDVNDLQTNPQAVPTDYQYMSDTGANEDSPVPTGYPILEETDYEKIPRADTHPQAGDDALPTDDDGNVIPPAIPVEPRRQLPIDELVAKKLRRGMVPVCLVGPPGSGKNYLLKYLAWATNRGYRSIDASSSTMAEDLFGPLTPDEDGTITPRNGAVKQGLLNGDLVVINEFPVMQASAATELHRLLNEGTLLIKSHGELIQPHPAAQLVITMNPPTKENRATEPMGRPTRGRFRRFKFPYPQSVSDEVRTLDQQVNTPKTVVPQDTLRKIVEFAHRTRKDENDHWPTLSTRNLTIVCEDIEDGVSPKAAVKGNLWGVAEPYQQPADAEETINELL